MQSSAVHKGGHCSQYKEQHSATFTLGMKMSRPAGMAHSGHAYRLPAKVSNCVQKSTVLDKIPERGLAVLGGPYSKPFPWTHALYFRHNREVPKVDDTQYLQPVPQHSHRSPRRAFETP